MHFRFREKSIYLVILLFLLYMVELVQEQVMNQVILISIQVFRMQGSRQMMN